MKVIPTMLFAFGLFMNSGLAQAPNKEEKYACTRADGHLVRNYFLNSKQNDAIMFDILRINTKDREPRLPFCWHGCAVSLPKPLFPAFAKQNRFYGTVKVEAIANENGEIFYAKAVDGIPVLRRNAEMAACASRFTPIIYEGKPINFRWKIIYNFLR